MIYEYECEKCGKINQVSTSYNKMKAWIKCNFCGNVAKKIISKSSFILKGKGWAKDGYSKDDRNN